jgi:phage-related protein
MVLKNEPLTMAQLHFEGDSLQILLAFPAGVKGTFGFSLRELQAGKAAVCEMRSMRSIGQGVFELKDSDERTWYRVIYLSKVGNTIYILHCFEKDSRKTDRRDIAIAAQRLKQVKLRLQE